MNVKKEVPNYTICKKLKELGISQTGSGWYWKDGTIIYIDTDTCGNYIKAPTYEELRIYLPNYIDRVGYKYIYEDAMSNVYIEYEGIDDKGKEIAIKVKGRTYAEAAGKMLCKLNKLSNNKEDKKYAKELAKVYEYNENCIIVYRAYSGANGDKGYKFYIK